MDRSLIASLKELEVENTKLKKMYSEKRLKAAILHKAIVMRYSLGSQSGFEIIRPLNNLFDRQSDVLKRHNTDV